MEVGAIDGVVVAPQVGGRGDESDVEVQVVVFLEVRGVEGNLGEGEARGRGQGRGGRGGRGQGEGPVAGGLEGELACLDVLCRVVLCCAQAGQPRTCSTTDEGGGRCAWM